MRDKKICTYSETDYRGNIAVNELIKKEFNSVTLDSWYDSWNQS